MTRFLLFLSLNLSFLACTSKHQESPAESQQQKQESQLVEMKLEAQRHAGLEVRSAAIARLNEYLQVTGTVQPIDARVAKVRPLAKGRLVEVLVKVGDRVRAGQPLARFDNIEAGELISQFQIAQAELRRLKVQHAAARKQGERVQSLASIGAVSKRDVESTEAEHEALQESIQAQESVITGITSRLKRLGIAESRPGNFVTDIQSPFSGVIIRIEAAPGESIDTDKQLFAVADLSNVWVQAEVYEKDLGKIRLGQPAFISVDTYPGERFTGRVSYVSDVLDPATRTARVRCEVSNRDMRLKLDMFTSVSVPTTFTKQALAVPEGAVQQMEGKNVLFIQRTDSKFEVRGVNVGKIVSGLTEITAGLAPGEAVVVRGAFHLKSIALGKEIGEEDH